MCSDWLPLCPLLLCREHPTSLSTEDAIQGMLSVASLLCSPKPEKAASPREPWWSGGEPREGPLSAPSPRQRLLQGDKSPMDSQGNSSEAWDNQGPLASPLGHGASPETDYHYCDPSMSPPLHPSKRHAPNPPPVSNQATKGATSSHCLLFFLDCLDCSSTTTFLMFFT